MPGLGPGIHAFVRAAPKSWMAGPSPAMTVESASIQAPDAPPRARGPMDRFIDGIELLAAIFVGLVAADIFISVLLRYFFSVSIPDSYDFGRLLLGILIFWGIAATSYRGTHITVDLVWGAVGPRRQRIIDVFATLVLLFVVTVQTITLFDKVASTRADNVLTFDLHLPTWPFFAIAWAGDVSAVVLIAIRTWRLVVSPEKMAREEARIKAVE
jgi:TRAP-type C4-dicarboxylate transport system permease small subunit